MTTATLAAMFRAHSRLEGALARNLESWTNEPGTLSRYLQMTSYMKFCQSNKWEGIWFFAAAAQLGVSPILRRI